MTITNKLNVTFNYDAIDADFDIYKISTSKNYIDKGARLLDTALDEAKALSVAFDYGKSAFLMFSKGKINQTDLGIYLKRQDDSLTVDKLHPSQLWEYILLRLFLHALANGEKDDAHWLSNLSGKFYVTRSDWMYYNGARLKVLEINVTPTMELTADAKTFTDVTKFGSLTEEYSRKFPMYALSRQKGMFKRIFTKDCPGSHVYICKAKNKIRSRVDFLDLSLPNNERKRCKSWYLFDTLEKLKKHFHQYFSIEFQKLCPYKVITEIADKDYMEEVKARISEKGINIFSLVEKDKEDCLSIIKKALEGILVDGTAITIGDGPSTSMFNIALIHNAEHYAENGLDDPYSAIERNVAIQAVTLEDSLEIIEKEAEGGRCPVLSTLLKELVIKDDVITRSKICLDDWSAKGFKESWVFGIEHSEPGKNNKRYFFMRISPDGSLEFAEKKPFKPLGGDYQACFDFLIKSKEKGKIVVSDGNNAIMISRTDRFPLPNPAIFEAESPRSNASKKANFNGLYGINYYREDGTEFYNVGFVDVNDIQKTIPNASVIYKTTILKGDNFIERFLKTMNVIFVKHNNFTVVPFPVKYLREQIDSVLYDEKEVVS